VAFVSLHQTKAYTVLYANSLCANIVWFCN